MSYPTSRSGITCLVPAPRRITSWFLPFQPFEVTLWIGVGCCLILEIFALCTMRKMEKEEVEEYSWEKCFKFGYISTLKLFISQSTIYVVNSTSVRMILLSCYVIDIIITSVYSGGLASILTIPSFEEAPDSIERLIKHKLIWAGTSPDWTFTLKNSQEDKMIQIVDLYRFYSSEELQVKTLTDRIGVVLERLQFGHFAIPAYIEQGAVNRMKMMVEDLFYEHCVAYTPRIWPLLEKFNNFCLLLQSSGLAKYWEWMVVARHLNEKMQKQIEASVFINFNDAGPVELGMDNFIGIIILWIGGVLVSVLSFVGEVFLHFRTLRS